MKLFFIIHIYNYFIFNIIFKNYRKDEAANKPKLEFVPKTLADLHVDGLPTSDAMNGGNFSLHGKTHFTHTYTK